MPVALSANTPVVSMKGASCSKPPPVSVYYTEEHTVLPILHFTTEGESL